MNIFSETPKIMWQVFEWAYDNDIDVMLIHKYGYNNESWPALRFSRGDKFIEQAFYPATHFSGQLESVWRNIALELCVSPLVLKEKTDNGKRGI